MFCFVNRKNIGKPNKPSVILRTQENCEQILNDSSRIKPAEEEFQLFQLVPVSLTEKIEVVTITRKVIV